MHGFEGDTPKYLPRGDRKALGSYIVCHPMPKVDVLCNMLFFLLVYESDSHGRLIGTIHNCHEKNTLFFFFFILTCFRTKLLQFNS